MSGPKEPLVLRGRRVPWRSVVVAVRPFVGWILAAIGALALFLGWWGVSGQSLTAKQLPYLASGGLAGVALVVLAAALLAADDVRRQLGRLDAIERKVDELYGLLVETDQPAEADGPLVALPTGASYHRAGCALVAGKTAAATVDAAAIKARSLNPCRVCSPPVVTQPPADAGQ